MIQIVSLSPDADNTILLSFFFFIAMDDEIHVKHLTERRRMTSGNMK